jgi:hypothetical protein
VPFNKVSEAARGNDKSSDIFIYCDQERLQPNTEGYWIDIDRHVALNIKEACQGKGERPLTSWSMGINGETMIQLCPWYMQYWLKEFQDNGVIYIAPNVFNIIQDIIRDLSTPAREHLKLNIKSFGLLDLTILHEVCITAVSCTRP